MDDLGRHSALISQRGGTKAIEGEEQIKHNRPDMTLKGTEMLKPEREYAGDDTVLIQTIWPAVIVQQQSNTLAMRHIIPRGVGAYELSWTFFGYADETAEMTEKRVMQANLMGPSGYVSIDDSEVIAFCQEGLDPYPNSLGVVEMDGKAPKEADTLVSEGAVRAFYDYYRKVMAL